MWVSFGVIFCGYKGNGGIRVFEVGGWNDLVWLDGRWRRSDGSWFGLEGVCCDVLFCFECVVVGGGVLGRAIGFVE